MLVRTWLFTALLLLVSVCGENGSISFVGNGSISFVGVDKLGKEARELFDIKVKVKLGEDTKNNNYYLELSHVKGEDRYFGGTVAREDFVKDGIVELRGIYFYKECSGDCLLVAEVLVAPKNCDNYCGSRCCTSPHSSATKASIPITVTPTPWRMEANATKGDDQIEVTVSKNGQPAAGVAAKIIACTNSGSSVRNEDNKNALYCHDSDANWMPYGEKVTLNLYNNLRGANNPREDVFAWRPPNWEYDTFGSSVQEITFNDEGRWTSKAKEYVDVSNICNTRVYVEVENRALEESAKCPSEEE